MWLAFEVKVVSPRPLHSAESINHVVFHPDPVRGRLRVQLRHGEDPMY